MTADNLDLEVLSVRSLNARTFETTCRTTPDELEVLIAKAREADVIKANLESLEARYPCDGGCSYEGGPEETCSAHGRTPAEVWKMADDVFKERNALASERDVLAGQVERVQFTLNGWADGQVDDPYTAMREALDARGGGAE